MKSEYVLICLINLMEDVWQNFDRWQYTKGKTGQIVAESILYYSRLNYEDKQKAKSFIFKHQRFYTLFIIKMRELEGDNQLFY